MEEMITIAKKEYDQFCKDSEWLSYLEQAGVDNWDGIDTAMEIKRDEQEDDE